MSDPAAGHIPRAELLKRLSDHLNALAGDVQQIEHAVSGSLDGPHTQDPNTVMRLQRLDFLRQSLEDLAFLSLDLSRTQGDQINVSVAMNLKLDATRGLLDRGCGKVQRVEGTNSAGDVDLF